MRNFYILFKNSTSIEGEVDCTEEEFNTNLITPNKERIHSSFIGKDKEEEKHNSIREVEELIRQL